jgi:hypothetical protein
MSGNVGGLLVIALGAVLVVMGIKGTQHDVAPQLFGQTGTNTPTYAPGHVVGPSTPNPIPGLPNICPPGQIPVGQLCISVL